MGRAAAEVLNDAVAPISAAYVRTALARDADDAIVRLGGSLLRPALAWRPLPAWLYVSPDGPLSMIPWAALGWGTGVLRDELMVVRSPSPRSFVRLRRAAHAVDAVGGRALRRPFRARRSLVLADADFGVRAVDAPPSVALRGGLEHSSALAPRPYRAWLRGLRLPRLPPSRAEAEVVEGAWPEARVLLGRDGAVPPLVGAGFLPVSALIGLDIDGIDSVVLSACSRSLGDVHPGEGVAGMAQALLRAGARYLGGLTGLHPVARCAWSGGSGGELR